MSALRVELFFDEEAGNWHHRVPALYINGGGTPTREDAERECLSAIAFALEGDPRDYDADAETLAFDVNVAPAVKNRLKRIQYRPGLINGFLAQTGLSLEPEPL
jgi:hypothetical protein